MMSKVSPTAGFDLEKETLKPIPSLGIALKEEAVAKMIDMEINKQKGKRKFSKRESGFTLNHILFKNGLEVISFLVLGLLLFMLQMGIIKTVFVLLLVAFGCSLRGQTMNTQEYIDAYKYAAMQEMKVYNIPASITLGQGILESASGNSRLATECNNHFGIKCRKEWTGAYCLADDDAPNECFRGYATAMESYRDHSLFLKNGSRYAGLFSLEILDYESWAEGLRKAGYATNPAYGTILSGLIKRYRLAQFDSMVVLGDKYKLPDTVIQNVTSINGVPVVRAKPGQSPEDIAKQENLGNWQIYRYNDLKRGESLDPGEIVYLKPKKRKGSEEMVTVKEGESMRDISQQYGIKLKHLYKKNRLSPGEEVKPGEVLVLQRKAAVAPATVDPESQKTEEPVKPVEPVKTKENISGFHEVKAGETLYAIAVKYQVTVSELMNWNNLGNTDIKTGQILVVKKGINSGKKDTVTNNSEYKKAVKFHIVMAGETLYTISKMYNQPVDSIKVWNKLTGNSIKAGQELLVQPPAKPTGNPKTYTVQPGDTLYSISRKFGVSVADLKLWNKLISDDILPGRTLYLQ